MNSSDKKLTNYEKTIYFNPSGGFLRIERVRAATLHAGVVFIKKGSQSVHPSRLRRTGDTVRLRRPTQDDRDRSHKLQIPFTQFKFLSRA